MNASASYLERRQQLRTYFDRTAAKAWERLTSDAPVGRIRATVRAGREEMRETLLGWLPDDLTGRRVLDAGCGTGALALDAARRGAEVVAVDLSETLLDVARRRVADDPAASRIHFSSGDMLSPSLGRFDHVVAMDSLIHYEADDLLTALQSLAAMTDGSIVFTFAPRTAPLALMHAVGRLAPRREHRAPAIVPHPEARLVPDIGTRLEAAGWSVGRHHRVVSGFYISQAQELTR